MFKILTYYTKFIDLLNKALDVFCILSMLVMVGVIFYAVIMRQVFQNPPAWAEEISLLIMVWFVYLGIVICLKENLHIGIEMLVDRLPRPVAAALEVLVAFIILGLSYMLWHFGSFFSTALWGNTLPATGLSVGWYYIIIAIAGVLMALVIVGQLAEKLLARKNGDTNGS